MSRPIKIVNQTRTYLNNALDIIRKLEDEGERLKGGERLMTRILQLLELYEGAFWELRGTLGLKAKP